MTAAELVGQVLLRRHTDLEVVRIDVPLAVAEALGARVVGIAKVGGDAAEAARANLAARCRDNYTMVQESRWVVIEDANSIFHGSFSGMVSGWLAAVFLSLGLQVPRRLLGAVVLSIGVVAVASVMFVILDLDTPYGGVFGITSSAMREALADMIR